jgi:CTP:molybdopterin cytidylyltransferase MocA
VGTAGRVAGVVLAAGGSLRFGSPKQLASLRAGVRALEDTDVEALVVVLGDEPLLSAEAVRRVLGARGDQPAVRATYSGTPVHPTLIERDLWPQLLALRGDHGAAGILGETGFAAVACDDLASPADIDTPDDLKALEPPP